MYERKSATCSTQVAEKVSLSYLMVLTYAANVNTARHTPNRKNNKPAWVTGDTSSFK